MTAVTLREMRDRYLHEAGLGDGGYDDGWVRVMLGPIPIVFPNTAGRKRVVPIHDLHHALTGYRSDWTGESEIAAWELATGCRTHVAAWFLNLSVLALGVLVAPRRTFRAFLRGRHTANLYGDVANDTLLARTVDDVRRELHLDDDRPLRTSASDVFAFARILAFTLPVIVFWLGPPALVVVGLLQLF
jgi:hypothetical protein